MQEVFDYITSEESSFKTLYIPLADNWEWNMAEHIQTAVTYKNSQYLRGTKIDRPFKNIILPILRLAYRTEGFDVKDISIFVNNVKSYFKSFLIRKYHDIWARQNDLDTMIDNIVETYTDIGGVLVKKGANSRPDTVPWQRIAFCDQTDVLAGPICEKYYLSPDELQDMAAKGWGDPRKGATGTIEEVITLSKNEKKDPVHKDRQARTPGKYIEVYELHGVFPQGWLGDRALPTDESSPENKLVRQLQIITPYRREDGKTEPIILYRGIEKESPYKFRARDPIYGRALGLGGVEELTDTQIWVNYGVIAQKEMLDAASKTVLRTTDSTITQKHPSGLKDVENLEIIEHAPGSELAQIDTRPINMPFFDKFVSDWQSQAETIGSGSQALMGNQPTGRTNFRLQALITQQALGIHEYRKGKIATFLAEIYRDWIIPHLQAEITNGTTFLAELDVDELQQIADSVVAAGLRKWQDEKVFAGKTWQPQEEEDQKQQIRDEFTKRGSKQFIEILKGEFDKEPLDVEIDIAGKQKALQQVLDTLSGIMRQIAAAPQLLDDPRMVNLLNQILEAGGFSPIDFNQKPKAPPGQPPNAIPGAPPGATPGAPPGQPPMLPRMPMQPQPQPVINH